MLTLYSMMEVIIIILPVLLSVAYVTIAERKTMGSMQRRVGPNYVGYYGLLQPFADALKLLVKETIVPAHANKILFFLGPIVTLIFSLLGWGVIPFGPGLAISDFHLGILFSLAVSSLGVYGILIAGWSANSKYAFIGCLRSTAQMISYELVLTSIILIIVYLTGSLNISLIILTQQAIWYLFPLLPIFLIFFIGGLAETNRAPFDLPEAESELVAGFMTEHSAAIFVFFFLAEYSNLILISGLISVLFLGGYLLPSLEIFKDLFFLNNLTFVNLLSGFIHGFLFGIKTSIVVFCFIWVRASFPRIRYDQLINFCWTILLPLVFAIIIFIFSILYSFDIIPSNTLFN